MDIHEYQAKAILRNYGLTTPEGVVISKKEDIRKIIENFDSEIYIVKAQIHSGGRGKGGGVKKAHSKEEAISLAENMYGMNLVTAQTGESGRTVTRIYIESGSNIRKEYYLSIIVDRSEARLMIIGSESGGVDIERVAKLFPKKIVKVSVDPVLGLKSFHCIKLALGMSIPKENFNSFTKVIFALYEAFVQNDALQIEINPLCLTDKNEFTVLDAKANFDDNAIFRHPNIGALLDENEYDKLELRASKSGLSYVKMEGNIGCMVNGAGLAMATMDIIKLFGAMPANFLDVGGGASVESVSEALKIIISDSSVTVVLINIFGGIMKCDVIAEGVIQASREIKINIPLVVRLSGTNFDLGKKMLLDSGLKLQVFEKLEDAAKKVIEYNSKI